MNKTLLLIAGYFLISSCNSGENNNKEKQIADTIDTSAQKPKEPDNNNEVSLTSSMSIIIQDAYCSEACHLVYIGGADGKEYNTFIDANTPNDFLSENNSSINSIYQNFNAIIETEEIMNDGEKTLLITEIELIGPVEEENIIEELEPVSFNNQKKYDWGSKPKEVDGPALWVYTGITCDALSYTMNSSSRLKSQGKNNYTVDQLNDDDPTTAWVEGVEGYGIGEYLDVTEMQVMNNKIHILNGYQKDISSFKNNSRVKVFMVEVGGINMFKLHLKDVMGVQTFEIPEYYANEIIGAYSVRFIIEDVYKGYKWDDTAISEIFTCGG